MTKILFINASPRGAQSQSAQLAQAYLDQRLAADPSLEIDVLNLWAEELPEFDGDKNAAKLSFFGVGDMTDQAQTAWDIVTEVTARFTQADEYVMAVPMWNGGVPYKLKHYIDVITQPGLLFGFDPEQGYFGLLEDKKAHVFYSAGVFAPGADRKYGEDYHSAYLEWWFGLVGIADVETVRLQPSILNADPAAAFETALMQAKAAA